LEAAGAGANLLFERLGQAAVALAEEAEVDGQTLGGLKHPHDVPGAWRTRRRVGPRRGTGAAAEKRGQAGGDGGLDQLRADEVDVAIDAAGRDDEILAGDDFGARADDELGIDTGLDERIARLADADDAAADDADVALDDAPVIEDHGVRD